MITEEEKQEIIDKAVEKSLLMLPEIVGNLILNQTTMVQVNRELYQKYPEFGNSKEIVASVIEKTEGENLGLGYKEVVDKAIPLIKERLKITKNLNMTSVNRPKSRTASIADNGEI